MNKLVSLLCVAVLCISCAASAPDNLVKITPNTFPKDYVQSSSGYLTQGGLLVLTLAPKTYIYLNDKPIAQVNGLSVIGFGRDAKLTQRLRLVRHGKTHRHLLQLQPRNYNVQYIEGVAKKYVAPPPAVYKRIRADGKRKSNARGVFHQKDWFKQGFIEPVAGVITGVYGSQRYFNGAPRRPHYGLDIAAPAATPVMASADGVITLAEADMYFEGGLVFINHGLHITSAYLHLQDVQVSEGDFVKQGDIIGTVGAGGRSTGAHLDWRVFWQGAQIDPQLLLRN